MSADRAGAAVCQICFEEGRVRLELARIQTGNGDVLRGADCRHDICCTCMAKHVSCRVEEQRVAGLCCPAVGCKNRLHEQDLRKLVSRGFLDEKVASGFVELSTRDFTARAREFDELKAEESQDYAFLRHLWERTRLCPRCSIALEKSHGCDSFFCICGHHFDFTQAPHAVGSAGVKKFGRLLSLAEAQHTTVRKVEQEAQRHGGMRIYRGALRLSQTRGMPLEEAVALCTSAQKGEGEARERIRVLRRPTATAAQSSAAPSEQGKLS